MNAAIDSSTSGSTVGRYSEMPGVGTVTALSARIASNVRVRPAPVPTPPARRPPGPRSRRPAGFARRAPCGCRSRATAATRQTRRPHRVRCRPGTGRAPRARRETSPPPSAPTQRFLECCAIVFAEMTGSARFTRAQFALHRADQRGRIERGPREDGRRRQIPLRERSVEHCGVGSTRSLCRSAVPVSRATPTTSIQRSRSFPFEPEAASDGAGGIAGAEVLPRHRLADHGDARRVPAIALVQGPAEQDGNAQHVEVVPVPPRSRRRRRSRVRSGGRAAFDDDRHANRLHRQAAREHGGLHAGNRADPASNLLVTRGSPPSRNSPHSAHRSRASPRRRWQSRRAPLWDALSICRKMLVPPSSTTDTATWNTTSAFLSVSHR